MEYWNHHPYIFLIAGKARQGKDTVGDMIADYNHNQKVIKLQYSHYIKEYAKQISDWDGSEETKPRELLQQLGTSLIREQINPLFFVNRMCEDILVYSYFYDIIIISDVRLEEEITTIQNQFEHVFVLHVSRPNMESELTVSEQKHLTEIGLDHFEHYDYEIVNDGTLEDLKEKIESIMKEVI